MFLLLSAVLYVAPKTFEQSLDAVVLDTAQPLDKLGQIMSYSNFIKGCHSTIRNGSFPMLRRPAGSLVLTPWGTAVAI